MKADVFRPQSVGRAVRTAFVLGVLLVIAIVAAVGAMGNFNALVGNAHSTIKPKNGGFTLDFPVPPTRQAERVATDGGTVDAPRDGVVVDDEINFDAVWFDLVTAPTDANKALSSMITRQVRQLGATKIAVGTMKRVDGGHARDFVAVNVDQNGLKRYYNERVILKGRSVWIIRIGSRVRRDAAFARFTDSFAFTG